MSSYGLPTNAGDDVLRCKIAEVGDNLHSLDISNCIVAIPAFLLSVASDLSNLQAISCVACPLKVSLLLDRLLWSFENVTQLEFSLVDGKDDTKEELTKIQCLASVHAGKETNIRKMYVEVSDKHNIRLLMRFLEYCPLLKELHVHFVHEVSPDWCALVCASIARDLPGSGTLTVTCEAPFTAYSDLRQPVDLRYCIKLHGTVVFRKNLRALNFAQLRDLALSPDTTLPLEPVVLVAVDSAELGFLIGILQHNWSHLRSLCFLLYAGNIDQSAYPTVRPMHDSALRQFFARLLNLVELNVSSLHFGEGVDFTTLLTAPAMQRLRALSLPPCGLRSEGAVRRLALKLGDVEDLDIRLNMDGRHKKCPSCANELAIDPTDASAFSTGIGRLTLSNVRNLVSLNFLAHFKMAHLRFIDDSNVPRFGYKALSTALRACEALRSLVIRMSLIEFCVPSFETLLSPVSALERLCLLTKNKLRASYAEAVVEAMASQLPSIFYLHIHYVDVETGSKTSTTWIRLPEGETAGRPSKGKVMSGKPCIMCSTQTFVALAKPRYREVQEIEQWLRRF